MKVTDKNSPGGDQPVKNPSQPSREEQKDSTSNQESSSFVHLSVNLQRRLEKFGFGDVSELSAEEAKTICDQICDSVLCDAIVCDNNMCDSICSSVCDQICDQICDGIVEG